MKCDIGQTKYGIFVTSESLFRSVVFGLNGKFYRTLICAEGKQNFELLHFGYYPNRATGSRHCNAQKFFSCVFLVVVLKISVKIIITAYFLYIFSGECCESRWIICFHRVLEVLTKKIFPYTGSNLLPSACLQSLISLRHLSLTEIFLWV